MKRRALLLAGVLLTAVAFAENITVATVNVWSGLTYRGVFVTGEYEDAATREFRFDLLANGLRALEPDVVAIQEANTLPGYAERLAGEISYDLVYDVRQAGVRVGPVGLPANLREGEALLAGRDRALRALETRQLVGPAAGNVAAFQFGSGSQIVAALIDTEARPVYLFTTRWTPSPPADRARLVELAEEYHAGALEADEYTRLVDEAVAGNERRRREARETVTFINELAGEEPVILMGSFYALPDSEAITVLREAGFIDVWQAVGRGAGFTWDATTNANIIEHNLASSATERARYDYVFIRGRGIAARSASIIFSRPTYGVHASDHFGLLAEIRVDP